VILLSIPTERGIAVIGRTTANGGAVAPVTSIEAQSGEFIHLVPRWLPDGDHFLYVTAVSASSGVARIGALERGGAPRAIDVGSVTEPIEYADGFVIYEHDNALLAQRLDPSALALRGPATVIADRAGEFAVAGDVVVYAEPRSGAGTPIGPTGRKLVWVDRHGSLLGEIHAPAGYRHPALSPDERRLAVAAPTPGVPTAGGDGWTFDIARGIETRLTVDPGDDETPLWSPDGTRVVFGSGRDGGPLANSLYQRSANGTGADERLLSLPVGDVVAPVSWAADGSFVLFWRARAANYRDKMAIWRLDLTGERTATPVLDDAFAHLAAQLSPDGRWIAYSTNESGSTQIVVQSFPDLTRDKRQVSTRGGYEPRWRGDGRELFYLTPTGTMMAVDVPAGDTFEPGAPTALFETGIAVEATLASGPPDYFYAVASNGERFLLSRPVTETTGSPDGKRDAPPAALHVIVNWSSSLAER